MRAARGLLALLAACAAPADAPAPRPVADEISWLAGHWVMSTTDGQVEEQWLPPAGGTLYGVGRTVSEGETRFFEFLAIEPREGPGGPTLAYVARPAGRSPTEFLLVELAPGRVVFGNSGHDFPKRIIYERRGEGRLHARVDDGTDAGEGEDFEYRRGK